MREGIDFAGTRPAAAALHAAGRSFVVRYVSTPGNGKNITAAEAAYWRQNAIDVAIVFETTAGRALAGAAAGAADAASARRQVIAAGGPADGGVIYFAVDVDTTTDTQRAAVASYLAGAAGVIGWDQVGVYGEYELVDHIAADTPCRWFWQTYAWSGGRGPHPRAQLYQYANAQRIGGIEVDYDQAPADDFGQWARHTQEDTDMTDDQARQLKAIYDQITGARAAGQHDFASTVEATLGTVQHLVNLVNSGQTTLGKSIADARSAVLATLAALPTAHLSDTERQQLAGDIAAALAQHGVHIDPGPLLDALATRLAA
ncbi:MAG TPA: glycoside hydrolase domain-containing protein [Mycobacteriales bacterium]|nr:glycoside hydrolase domain-containing protein [Mycobacteriales bacterium]